MKRRRRSHLTAAATLAALFTQLGPEVRGAGKIVLNFDRSPAGNATGDGGSTTSSPQSGALREQTIVNAREALARTTATLQSIAQAQAAARAAAAAGANNLGADPAHPGQNLPDVPDGLAIGGLQVAPGVPADLAHPASGENASLWQGARLPVQSTVNGKIQVSVTQTASQALLTWQTFNIGKQTTLAFDQSAGGGDAGKWVVFNQINDPSGSPTQILGSITAAGQVYVINRNGIIFGGSSQVNARGFTASALPVNQNLIDRGLLNNPDSQFLFTGVAETAGANGTPAFTPDAAPSQTGRYGDILVQAGALLESALAADNTGGRIALVGANVVNDGTIRTPAGQTLLAAGLQVGVAAHASSDASLRGLDVYVGEVGDYAGSLTQNGLIEVARGNASLNGKAVAVNGAIDSSTSVDLNGRIVLNANYGATANPESALSSGDSHIPFLFRQSGSIFLGDSSVLRIRPETESKATIASTTLPLRSQLDLGARTIYAGKDSTLYAPSAIANLNAGVWQDTSSGVPATTFVNAGGQIYFDQGSLLYVAGSAGVDVPVSQNIVAVELRGSELADSPLQRNSFLRGQTIYVDVRESGVYNGKAWVGTPLADASGYIGLIQRGVGELTTVAGSVNLNAGGSIVLREGSGIDVSGGWINYTGGTVRTTRLLLDGHLVDIADASPDVRYGGIYNGVVSTSSTRWGNPQTFQQGIRLSDTRFEAGYVSGAAGGTLRLTAGAMALDGDLHGLVVAGERQRDAQPASSKLELNFTSRELSLSPAFPVSSPTPPAVVFTATPATPAPAGDFATNADGSPQALRADRAARVDLSSSLLGSFGSLTVENRDGDILVPAGVTLSGQIGGALSLGGANIDVQGSILIPSGQISLSAYAVSYARQNELLASSAPANPGAAPGRGVVTLGSSARISTAGSIVSDYQGVTSSLPTAAAKAGSITLAGYDLNLGAGSVIDVSGGLSVSAKGKIAYGDAGSISLLAGRDPALTSVLGGSLTLDATLLGYAGASARSGALTVQSSQIQVGGASASEDVLVLDAGFFRQGGFSSFTVSGLGATTATTDVYLTGVVVAAGEEIHPEVQNLFARIDPSTGAVTVEQRLFDEGARPAASLTFKGQSTSDPYASQLLIRGAVELLEGAVVRTDAKGSVSFDANTVGIHGSVIAPGGSISIKGGGSYQSLSPDLFHAAATVELGANARLDASGAVLLKPDTTGLGLRSGSVLDGGRISVSGNILGRSGAVLDVSGASGELDLLASSVPDATGPRFRVGADRYVSTVIDSDGGSISLSGGEVLASDAALVGRAGGGQASGGTLSVSSGRFYLQGATTTTADINLTVTQSGAAAGAASAGLGHAVLDTSGVLRLGGGQLAVDTFAAGGFDNLKLVGNVAFSGPVSISTGGSIRVATSGVIQADSAVSLASAYVAVGQDFRTPQDPTQEVFLFTRNIPGVGLREYNFAPTHGAGSLDIDARHIDVGTLSLAQIGTVDLTASGGDVRGNGQFNLAGDLTITAGQVYPTTASSFTVSAFDYTPEGGTLARGSITIRGDGSTPAFPASAAGTLALYASDITQAGVLRAPFGVIRLGRDSTSAHGTDNALTGTADPLAQNVTLAESSATSISAYPAGSSTAVTLPYGLILNGTSWIDPRGVDITLSGLPDKNIALAGANLSTASGAVLDTRGGGDLYAYRFIPGVGGTSDLLASTTSFAIIPGKQSLVAPYALYNANPVSESLGGDAGYVNSTLSAGEQIYLDGSTGVPAGAYTLLPARYALLPGAYLVTPRSGDTVASAVTKPDGSRIVAGYRINGLTGAPTNGRVYSNFEVAAPAVVRQRAEYADSYANTFLPAAAKERGITPARVPRDAGRLAFSASGDLSLEGSVLASPAARGRGSQVDVSSALDIYIGSSAASAPAGSLFLDSSVLGGFGAASLLIGGTRDGANVVTTTARAVTVDNAASPLTGSDLILVARENLTVTAGSVLSAPAAASGALPAESITVGTSSGGGDGALLRVASGDNASVTRLGIGSSGTVNLTIGDDVRISGDSAVFDSSAATSLSAEAVISVGNLGLSSGRISLVLDDAGDTSGAGGLLLSGASLDAILASAKTLSLQSYSSLDLFGQGTVGSASYKGLSLSAPSLRHFGSGDVEFRAAKITLGNASGIAAAAAASASLDGELRFSGGTVALGAGSLETQGFATTRISAADQILLSDKGGLFARGDLALATPVVTGATGADQTLEAAGHFSLGSAPAGAAVSASGLGAKLALRGASVSLDTTIRLPSGTIDVLSRSGDLTIGANAPARLDVSGSAQKFYDLTRVTDAGSITLAATLGDVVLSSGSTLDVSANAKGGKAGRLSVATPAGQFSAAGDIRASGSGGGFALDTRDLASTSALDARLDTGGFDGSRSFRVRSGDVALDGDATAAAYSLSADAGSITVTGHIDASGTTGGDIDLRASGSLTLASGASLDVSAAKFDSAGKGGDVHLEAGAETGGVIDPAARLSLQSGATIDLAVAEKNAASASLGHFSGTLRLRAPLTTGLTDVRVDAIGSALVDPAYVSVEAYRLYDLTASGGTITTAVQNQIRTDAQTLLGAAGTSAGNYAAIHDRLVSLQPALGSALVVLAGAEVVNRTGNLTLGTTTSTTSADWNLASFRFGSVSAPGVLTLRAGGDIVFYNALSDGFSGGVDLWRAPLQTVNAALPVNLQSWSYRMAAGADFTASDSAAVRSVDSVSSGSILIGKNSGAAVASGGNNAATSGSTTPTAAVTSSAVINNRFQVIRTGTGDIELNAAQNIRLLNPFVSIYTAGVAVPTPTQLFTAGDFVVPSLTESSTQALSQTALGARQQAYAVQYSLAGGDVSLDAGRNIERLTRNSGGELIADSSRQLPNNWLYRRSYLNSSGEAGALSLSTGPARFSDAAASTTWWVDFSNFFDDVGALGGGSVTLVAGQDVANVNANVATNARMPRGKPDASKLVELGGGDLVVRAGRDIDGGVYYVQKGAGLLHADGSIHSNATRSLDLGILADLNNPARFPEDSWLPTTLFLGDATFEVSASGDVLLGPVANPQLLPQGNGNRFWYKTYFSTYGENSGVSVSSLAGDVTLRDRTTLPTTGAAQNTLEAWLATQNVLSVESAAFYQPWLRLAETEVAPFSALTTLYPTSLRATAFSGDLNLVGNFTLFPSKTGTLELLAASAINGLGISGRSPILVPGSEVNAWLGSTLNLSDASPASIANILQPFAYYSVVGSNVAANTRTNDDFLASLARFFTETGAANSVLQTRQTLHASGLLHADDPSPVYLYAAGGDLSGLTLYSAKPARIVAARDISDIAFFIQNNRADQISLVTSGRDIVAYDANSALLTLAQSSGNALNQGETARGGDIQISGPGTLEVIAGRNLDLGIGAGGSDGTGAGITSIGNVRNPYLPEAGADLFVAAGLGSSLTLDQSSLHYTDFIAQFLAPSAGDVSDRYLKELAKLIPGSTNGADAWARFQSLSTEEQSRLATSIFYLVLRDAGRDYNDPESDHYREYTLGYKAIDALMPGDTWDGDISLTARQIKTAAGGDIAILAAGGGITVGLPVANARVDQGILTEDGGNISIFTEGSVSVGTSRIFTLRGGNIAIWSSDGDIAAGSAAKTVRSAPPTRVVIDPQSAAVQTDLSGLATGGGIGVLQTVQGVPPGDVDLIAPTGTIDAGDAGIRVSGNINLAAVTVLNAANIQAGGTSGGVPVPAPTTPSLGGLSAATSAATVAGGDLGQSRRDDSQSAASALDQAPSLISVEVLGYGGDEEDDKEKT